MTIIDRTQPIVATSYESPRNGGIMDEAGPITVHLNGGREVLAKYYGEDLNPIRYRDVGKARVALARMGAGWHLIKSVVGFWYLAKDGRNQDGSE